MLCLCNVVTMTSRRTMFDHCDEVSGVRTNIVCLYRPYYNTHLFLLVVIQDLSD